MRADRTSMRSRRLVALVLVLVLAATACRQNPSPSVGAPAGATAVRAITFPAQASLRFTDNYGDCRGSGCSRRHEGIDMLGPKLTPLVAAANGKVTYVRSDGGGSAGNTVAITDAAGWTYWYLHLNNDTPGTDDGANPARWALGPGMAKGAVVTAGQVVGYVGDSGNAEGAGSQVHFEIEQPGGTNVNPYASLRAAAPPATVVAPPASPTASPTVAGERMLRRGLSGPDVLAWQQALVAELGPLFVPNGVFGPATEAATKQFQASAGLTVDGIVGPLTRRAMAERRA